MEDFQGQPPDHALVMLSDIDCRLADILRCASHLVGYCLHGVIIDIENICKSAANINGYSLHRLILTILFFSIMIQL